MLRDRIEVMGMCLLVVCQMSRTADDSERAIEEAKDLYKQLTGDDWPYGVKHSMNQFADL